MDMGPNWIHGSVNNPISDIAKRTNTEVHDWDDRQAVFDKAGVLFSNDRAEAASGSVWSTITKAFKYSDRNSADIDPSRSLMDFFKEEVPKTENDPQLIQDTLDCASMWGAFVGDPIEQQSLKFFFLEETVDGENAFMAGTYKKVLDDIAAPALAKAEIKLNTAVKNIHNQVPPQTICLTTADDSIHIFDEVVVTCPLGWLKRHHTAAFSPPLPPRLSSAISSIGYGRLEKVYITFPTAWWNVSPDADDPKSSWPGFTQYLAPSYTPHPSHLPWNQQCGNMAGLPESSAHPTLLYYIYGPCATHIVSQLSTHTPYSPAWTAALISLFQPFYSRLPKYDPESPDCTPTAFLTTAWQEDEYAGYGSYTNFQIGLTEGDKDIEVMREGLGKERAIWFAGEHTAPFVALGTTTGAYWSGEGVGRRLAAKWGLSEESVDGNIESKLETEPKGKEISDREKDAANKAGLAL
ncbi:MAG: hypothetical protein Q9227_003816 [Pyrenula ochraceoflavens]